MNLYKITFDDDEWFVEAKEMREAIDLWRRTCVQAEKEAHEPDVAYWDDRDPDQVVLLADGHFISRERVEAEEG